MIYIIKPAKMYGIQVEKTAEGPEFPEKQQVEVRQKDIKQMKELMVFLLK